MKKTSPKYNFDSIGKKPVQNIFDDDKKSKGRKSPKKTTAKEVKKVMGRPTKNPEEKLSKKVTINLTVGEFEILKNLSKEKFFDTPIPTLIRKLLKNAKHI